LHALHAKRQLQQHWQQASALPYGPYPEVGDTRAGEAEISRRLLGRCDSVLSSVNFRSDSKLKNLTQHTNLSNIYTELKGGDAGVTRENTVAHKFTGKAASHIDVLSATKFIPIYGFFCSVQSKSICSNTGHRSPPKR
jgi:hypothetical protein